LHKYYNRNSSKCIHITLCSRTIQSITVNSGDIYSIVSLSFYGLAFLPETVSSISCSLLIGFSIADSITFFSFTNISYASFMYNDFLSSAEYKGKLLCLKFRTESSCATSEYDVFYLLRKFSTFSPNLYFLAFWFHHSGASALKLYGLKYVCLCR
jgi:hypothetical protein